MLFNDASTLQDIMGCYLVASSWREGGSNNDIDKQVTQLLERIEDKLKRTHNKTRHTWFTVALEHAQRAQQQIISRVPEVCSIVLSNWRVYVR